jgi:CRISPR/Cas system-associated exonuclease Cas4 (RecB family)
MNVIKISQSLMKALFNYRNNNECGIRIYERYVKGTELETSDAMNMGNWFEYQCTAQLPRSGKMPEPERLKNGELSAAYRKLDKQIARYHEMIEQYGIKILHTGYSFDTDEYGTGISDIIAEWNGKKCIIDIKTTSKIDDKWSEYGWGDEKFEYVDSPNTQALTIQAVQYKLLALSEFGDCDFYFFVFSVNEEDSAKIFKVEVDERALEKHKENIYQAHKYFNQSFVKKTMEELATPELKRCQQCQLKTNCAYAINIPLIKNVQVY